MQQDATNMHSIYTEMLYTYYGVMCAEGFQSPDQMIILWSNE